MLLSKNKKNNVYPCKLQCYYIIVGFKGVKIILACFRDARKSSHPLKVSFVDSSIEPGNVNINPALDPLN